MTGEPRDVRCGLDRDHDPHEHWQGHCDGQAVDPALVAGPAVPVATLYGAVGHPRPWTWSSLTLGQAKDLREQLDRFADHHNRTYVVDDKHLILACWPLHPGLAHELAALYGTWVTAFASGLSSAELAMGWHDRWLPGFHERLPHWYGIGSEACRPGDHVAKWNPAEAKISVAGWLSEDPQGRIEDAIRGLVDNPAYLDGRT